MAELTYVKSGERIGAHTINGIIDAFGGPSIPSDGDFTTTSKGALFRKAYSTGAGITNKLYEFLDIKQAEAPAILSCAYKTIYVNLGRDLDFAKNKLDSDVILCYDGDNEEGFEISASDFYINGEGEDGPNFYDGYVCTKLSAVQKFTVGEDEEKRELGYGDGTLYGWKFEAKKDDGSATAFVVTNENDEDIVKGFLENQGYSEPKFRQKRKLAISTNSAKGNVLIKIPEDVESEPEDIRFKLRGTIEKNDSGEKRFKVEYYQGYFLADDKDVDTGVRWNNHQFNDITPDPALGWHTLSVSNWMNEISEKIPVYLNLTATYEPATGSGEDFNGQFEVSLEAAEEGRSIPHRNEEDVEEEGTNSISSTYVIGQIDFEGESVKVKQNIIGEQTNIELFNEEAIEGALADLSSKYFSVDSGLSVLQLSSIERHEYTDEDGTVLGTALEIYQFHDIENGRDIDDNDTKLTDFIVRTKSENGLPAEVQYLNLSSVLNQISGTCSCEISGDSQISTLQLSSVVFDTITHTITDEQGMEKVVSALAVSLFNFNNPNGLTNNANPWQLSAHDFVLRKHDGSNMYLEYWSLSNVLSTESISTDNQLPFGLSSLLTKHYDQGKYHQIFGFEDLTNGKDASEVPEAQVLVRNSDGHKADIQYVNLSSLSGNGGKISVDTEIENQTSSIQLLSTSTGEWYQLYNFNKTNADVPAKIWTLGDLDYDKSGKTGKLIDPTTKELLNVDILVRDNSTKQLKYMNLSVDPINVDTYSTNTKIKSLTYQRDQFADRDFLTLRNFSTLPDSKLTAVISGDGLVDVTGQNTWILTKKYNPLNQMMELTYDKLQLSVDLSASGSEINVDTEIPNLTSSLLKLSNDDNEWYQLYNFDKSSVDLTVASDLNGPGRWYAPAPTGLTDTSALFLVKDTQSKQLKYAQLSVTPPAVDNCSIQRFWSPDFPGQPQMLSLNRFWLHPLDGTITGVLSSNNQVVTFSEPGGTGTFLMQNYLNGRLNLKYMKLQLSVDLSAVSADVKCDTDSTAAQKSIEKNAGYIQLHDFPNPTITTKKTTLDNLSATYDLLDTNDAVLVRSGTELKYKKLQIETKLPGGGSGPTSGYTGSIVGDCTLKWNSRGTYRIELWGKDMTYENGLLKSVGNERLINELETVGYSGS